jgi:hypothetical protein
MLREQPSHKEYIQFVETWLHVVYPQGPPPIHAHVATMLMLVDLTPMRNIIQHLYSVLGRPARAPENLLRSLLCMVLCGYTSITRWISKMRSHPFYAIVSGFLPYDVPGVGTFYDFMNLVMSRKPREGRGLSRRKRKPDEKGKPKHSGIIKRLADRLLSGKKLPLRFRDASIIKEVFDVVFAAHSKELGLIDEDNLIISGDGSKFPTWASPYGKKLCECKGKCDCIRKLLDQEAEWGWDSYRKQWVYGYTYYELVTQDRQLPVTVHLATVNRHDSVMTVYTMEEAKERQFSIKYASFDSASDAYEIYQLGIKHWDVGLVIPLNETNKGNYKHSPPIAITEDGVPICQAGLRMANWGFCKDRCRIKWRCPVVALKRHKDFDCPFFGSCTDSQYGRVIFTKPDWDYRIHTPVPRNSKLWHSLEKGRSASERSNKRKKYDFLLLQTRTSGRKLWFFRVMLASMCQHIDEWYREHSKAVA